MVGFDSVQLTSESDFSLRLAQGVAYLADFYITLLLN